MRHRLGIVVTHPIQYQAPWFRALASQPELDLTVIFGRKASPQEQAACGFGVPFEWDVPLLDGYEHVFLTEAEGATSGARANGSRRVGKVLRELRFDAVLVNGWHARLYLEAIRTCWRSKTPVMVRSDSHLRTKRHTLKRALKQPAYRWFLRRMDACLAVGTWSREYFLHFGVPSERIFIVPHTIDAERFQRQAEQEQPRRSELRARWGLRADSAVFLFSGKFIEQKRPLDFVRAVALAARSGANLEGLMVGDGPLRPACEQLVNQTGAPVRFAGFLNQSQVVSSYVACDALVLPSESETWGMVVNEAMTCGRSCIVSDRVGCGSDLIDDSTGAVFPMGDVAALAEVMIRFARDADVLAGMGKCAAIQMRRCSIEVATKGALDAIWAVTT